MKILKEERKEYIILMGGFLITLIGPVTQDQLIPKEKKIKL